MKTDRGRTSNVAVVRTHILSRCSRLPIELVDVREAVGRVTARAVVARRRSPPWDSAAMDGIAVAAGPPGLAVGTKFTIAGTVLAGDPIATLPPGMALRVMTGAPLPRGADTVIPKEEITENGPSVILARAADRGANVRRAGEDVEAGDLVVRPGETLTAFQVAALITAAVAEIDVVRQPRVALLITGTEVASGRPAPTQIGDTAGPLVRAGIERVGAAPLDPVYVRDDPDALRMAMLSAAGRADAIVSTGGVSFGDRDIVADVANSVGKTTRYALALKPGRPFVHGEVAERPFFGLPGNPGAASAVFELLVAPALRSMGGQRDLDPATVSALLAIPVSGAADGRRHALRAACWVGPDGGLRVRAIAGQGSHLVARLADVNALMILPDGSGRDAGAVVDVIVLGPVGSTEPGGAGLNRA